MVYCLALRAAATLLAVFAREEVEIRKAREVFHVGVTRRRLCGVRGRSSEICLNDFFVIEEDPVGARITSFLMNVRDIVPTVHGRAAMRNER